jgi:hypothetical protein
VDDTRCVGDPSPSVKSTPALVNVERCSTLTCTEAYQVNHEVKGQLANEILMIPFPLKSSSVAREVCALTLTVALAGVVLFILPTLRTRQGSALPWWLFVNVCAIIALATHLTAHRLFQVISARSARQDTDGSPVESAMSVVIGAESFFALAGYSLMTAIIGIASVIVFVISLVHGTWFNALAETGFYVELGFYPAYVVLWFGVTAIMRRRGASR